MKNYLTIIALLASTSAFAEMSKATKTDLEDAGIMAGGAVVTGGATLALDGTLLSGGADAGAEAGVGDAVTGAGEKRFAFPNAVRKVFPDSGKTVTPIKVVTKAASTATKVVAKTATKGAGEVANVATKAASDAGSVAKDVEDLL